MTVAEMRGRMSTAEYGEWAGFYQWKKAQEKRQMDKQNGPGR